MLQGEGGIKNNPKKHYIIFKWPLKNGWEFQYILGCVRMQISPALHHQNIILIQMTVLEIFMLKDWRSEKFLGQVDLWKLTKIIFQLQASTQ